MAMSQILSAIMLDAKLHPGQPYSIRLKSGLRVGMRVTPTRRELTLFLERQGTYPSTTEWDTVMQYLKEDYQPLHSIIPDTRVSESGAHFLFATWKLKEAVQL